MKRWMAFILVLSLMMTLISCTPKDRDGVSSPDGSSSVSSEEGENPDDDGPVESGIQWAEKVETPADIAFSDIYERAGNGIYRASDISGVDLDNSILSIAGDTLLITTYEDTGLGGYPTLTVYDVASGKTKAQKALDYDCSVLLLSEDKVLITGFTGEFSLYNDKLELVSSYSDSDVEDPSYVCWGVTSDGKYLIYSPDGNSLFKIINLKDGREIQTLDMGYTMWGSFNYGGKLYFTNYDAACPILCFDSEAMEISEFGTGADVPYVDGLILRSNGEEDLCISPIADPSLLAVLKKWGQTDMLSYAAGSVMLCEYDFDGYGHSVYLADIAGNRLHTLPRILHDEMPVGAVSENGYALFLDGGELYIWDYVSSESDSLDMEILNDKAMLAEADALCTQIKEDYGIGVYVGKNGNDFVSDEYLSKTVTDPYTILSAVRIIYDVLKVYPEGIIKEMCAGNVKEIDFYLSGELYPLDEYGNKESIGLTYTLGNTRVIVADISYSLDELDDTVVHELMHVMDDRIQEKEIETGIPYLSAWNGLVPDGFDYYWSYQDRYGNPVSNTKYTMAGGSDSDIWFVDAYSKTFPTEDRARVLQYLMRGYFEEDSEALRGEELLMKARFLCATIRECFDCIDDDDVLPWESILGEIDISEFDDLLLPSTAA